MALGRAWDAFMAKAELNERAESPWPVLPAEIIRQHKANIRTDLTSYLLKLPQPIVSKVAEVIHILDIQINGKRARIYPPFPLNERGAMSGPFLNTYFPVGMHQVNLYSAISKTAMSGFTSQLPISSDSFYCEGVRIDAENSADLMQIVSAMLNQTSQYTMQWWLRAQHSPFRGPIQFGFQVGQSYEPTEELRYHGAGRVESAWYAVHCTQKPLGIERPLDNGLWLLIGHHMAKQTPVEAGLIAFIDALASYMAGSDEMCVFNLCLCVEILANKRRILQGKRDVDANELIKTTDLINDSDRATLKKLFIDRGHIAHGRQFHILGRDTSIKIETHIECVRQLVNGYLHSLTPGSWPTGGINIGKSGNKNS